MIKDYDFSGLECISAVKNISNLGSTKGVICTITFIKSDDENKVAKLSYACTVANGTICTDSPIKVAFTGCVNNTYRKSSRLNDENKEVLSDIAYIDFMFDRSDISIKRVFA